MSTPALPTAKPEEVGLSSSRLDTLSGVLRTQVERGHIPGAVAIVSRNGRIAYHESFGVCDPNARDPMPKDAIFRIYSMSKAIVSVATMMLWEEGKFLLNEPASKYISAFAGQKVLVQRNGTTDHVAVEREATIQDLLCHTSGLTYEFRGAGPVHKAYMDAKVYRRSQTNADQAETLGKLPLLHQPGTRWE